MTDNSNISGINGTQINQSELFHTDNNEVNNNNSPANPENDAEMVNKNLLEADTEVDGDNGGGSEGKKRPRKPFPVHTFDVALELADAIQQHAAGRPVRRMTLFAALKRSPDSNQTRDWITSANKYGLISGGKQADTLELTNEGRIASGDEFTPYERTGARVELAIFQIPIFRHFYDELAGKKLPAREFIADLALGFGIPPTLVAAAVDTFIVNAKFVGLLTMMAGVERLLKVEDLLDMIGNPTPEQNTEAVVSNTEIPEIEQAEFNVPQMTNAPKATLEEVCFYVTPIGEPNSEHRQHADLFFSYIIEPALKGTGLKVIRADKIDRPGIIGNQIIRYLLSAKLVIADLSFHNPNVFYELAIRHASRLPTVHILRANDPIPFDLNQMRMIKIDTSSIYTLIPQLETYKSEIATQVRRALDDVGNADNPISVYSSTFRITSE